jgi:hypothetical protein
VRGLCEADDGVRTRDPQLGKLMLYQLSYVRVSRILPGLLEPSRHLWKGPEERLHLTVS